MQALNKSHGTLGVANGKNVKKRRYGTFDFGAIFIQHITRENACQLTDVLLCVAFQCLPIGAHLRAPIDVQPCQADGEQLHDFAGIVFIRLAS